MFTCRNCNKPLELDAAFCDQCGEMVRCVSCERNIGAGSSFCDQCGANQEISNGKNPIESSSNLHSKKHSPKEQNLAEDGIFSTAESKMDQLYRDAIDVAIKNKKISIANIQRNLNVGFNLAAKLIEQMKKNGIVVEAEIDGRNCLCIKNALDIGNRSPTEGY